MTCRGPHKDCVNKLAFATQLTAGQTAGRPRCRNTKCNLPLKKDGTCVRGCAQEDRPAAPWQDALQQNPLDVEAIQQAVHELTGFPPFADVRLEMDEQAEEYVVYVTPQAEFTPEQHTALAGVLGVSSEDGEFQVDDTAGDGLANRLLGIRAAQLLLRNPPSMAQVRASFAPPAGTTGGPAGQTMLTGADEYAVYAVPRDGTARLIARHGSTLYLAAADAAGKIEPAGVIQTGAAAQAQQVMAGLATETADEEESDEPWQRHCATCGRFLPTEGAHDCPGETAPATAPPDWVTRLQEQPQDAEALYDALGDLTGIPDVCTVDLEVDEAAEQVHVRLWPPDRHLSADESAALLWLFDAEPPAGHGVVIDSTDPAATAKILLAKAAQQPADVEAFLNTPAMQDAIRIHGNPTAPRPSLERAQAMYRQALRLARAPGNGTWREWAQNGLADMQAQLDWRDLQDMAEVFQAGLKGQPADQPEVTAALARNVVMPFWVRLHNFGLPPEGTWKSPTDRLPAGTVPQLIEYGHRVAAFLGSLSPEMLSAALADVWVSPEVQEGLQQDEEERQMFCRGRGLVARSVLYAERRRGQDPARRTEERATLLAYQGQSTAAWVQYAQARVDYEQAGDVAGQARSAAGLAALTLEEGDLDGTESYFQEALGLGWQAAGTAGQGARARALVVGGVLAYQQGDYSFAIRRLEEARQLYQAAGDLAGEADACWAEAQLTTKVQDPMRALDYYDKVASLQVRAENWVGYVQTRLQQAALAHQAGELGHARAYLVAALPVWEVHVGDVGEKARFLRQIGRIAEEQRDWEGAVTNYREAATSWRAVGEEAAAQEIEGQIAALEQLRLAEA